MSEKVRNGVLCYCSYGSAPCPLLSRKGDGPEFEPDAEDHVPGLNFEGFSTCASPINPSLGEQNISALGVHRPVPCHPETPGKWQMPSGRKDFSLEGARLLCRHDGVIRIA